MTQLPPSDRLAKGDVIGERYVVARELGRGGMAYVYLCDDRVSGDKVAVKVLFSEAGASTQKHAAWFYQEARALAALDHPAVVRARDFGAFPDGSLFLVMDAVRGRTLHAWKQHGKLPYGVVWALCDQVLAGLAHAHARGVIHGDLKPSNVMLAPGEAHAPLSAHLLDLGLAWLFENRADPRLTIDAPGAPSLPIGSGTVGWLAPEQIRRATPHIGPPTDLYALGCILFELLAGREVFEGEPNEVLRAHRDTPAPAPALDEGVPPAVGPFVTRLLAKRPWKRFQLAADARAAWQAVRPARPAVWRISTPTGWVDRTVGSPTPAATAPRAMTAHGLAAGIIALRPCPIIGRERERAALRAALDAVIAGEGPRHRVVVIEGEAGVGKSRLAEWACEYAHEHGVMIPLRARYWREPSPHDGLRGALLTHYKLVGYPRDVVERVLLNEWQVGRHDDEARARVAATVSWLMPTSPSEPTGEGPAGKRVPVDRPELVFAVARHALGRVAGERPLLLWLDDLPLAPTTTFEALSHLHDDAPTARVLVIATARSEALAADRDAAARVEGLAALVPSQTITLEPLDAPQTCQLLHGVVALAPEAEAVVVARSHGNPLFALQLVHAWASGGHLEQHGGVYQVSTGALRGRAMTTEGLWEERFGALPPALQPAADVASALGNDIADPALRALVAGLGFDAGEVVRALQRAEILLPDAGGRWRWAHALLHEYAGARLRASPDATRVLARAAEVLAAGAEANTERVVRQRVDLLFASGAGHDAAALALDYATAAWRSGRMAELRTVLAPLEGRVEGADRARYERWTAELARDEGRYDEARARALRAREGFEGAGLGADAARCGVLLAEVACDQGSLDDADALLDAAYGAFVADGDDLARAACEAVRGRVALARRNDDAAAARFAAAVEGFRPGGAGAPLARSLLFEARATLGAGRPELARERAHEARRVFDDLADPTGRAEADLLLARVAHQTGDLAAARVLSLGAAATFEDSAHLTEHAECLRVASAAALDEGDMAAATALGMRFAALAARAPAALAESHLIAAQIALAEGDLKAARRRLALAADAPTDAPETRQHRALTFAWYHLLVGAHDDAVAALTEARGAFTTPRRAADHTGQLLARLLPLARGGAAAEPLILWQLGRQSARRPASAARPRGGSTDRP